MNIKNSKCLVIGGAGFIGSFVVKELLKEDVAEVIIYDNFARGKMKNIKDSLRDERCKIFPLGGDIRETDVLNEAMKNVDYVFCLAAMWLLHCKDFPRTAFDVNIAGTFNVLEACVNNNIKKLIWSSSASVYGDAVEIPMTENHPFKNKNFYGATKIAGEAMATAFNDRYGLNIIGLRYMNVYGPGQDQTAAYTGVVPIMLNKIDANETPVINGDGSQAYDFIYRTIWQAGADRSGRNLLRARRTARRAESAPATRRGQIPVRPGGRQCASRRRWALGQVVYIVPVLRSAARDGTLRSP